MSQWHGYALAILHCWRPICTVLNVKTPPLVHIAMVLTEHVVLHCPAHDQARRESWPNLHYQSNPKRLQSFLGRIGAVIPSQE